MERAVRVVLKAPVAGSLAQKLALSAILAACCLGSTGCVSNVPYSPELDIVQRVGVEQARARLKALIEQAEAPQMTKPADVRERSMKYTFL